MNTPTRGRRVTPRACPSLARASSSHLTLSPSRTHVEGFRESAPADVLLDYRWLALCLWLSLAPLLASAQATSRGQSAIGLRFEPSYDSRLGAEQLLRNVDLSYRYGLSDQWSLELTAGFWRETDRFVVGNNGQVTELWASQLDVTLTAQHEWQLKSPQWQFYLGAGLGVRDYRSVRFDGQSPLPREGRVTNVTVQGVVGFRYQFKRAPLELDLGLRPQYNGRGFGLELGPSVGLRYRFGGRK